VVDDWAARVLANPAAATDADRRLVRHTVDALLGIAL
jgi:hypothetical protein